MGGGVMANNFKTDLRTRSTRYLKAGSIGRKDVVGEKNNYFSVEIQRSLNRLKAFRPRGPVNLTDNVVIYTRPFWGRPTYNTEI